MKVESENTINFTFWKNIWYLLKQTDFMSALVTLVLLFLVISGLQYWITDYVVSVLGHSKETAFIIFIIVGALGPIVGVAFSGCIFDRIGGYHGRNTPMTFTILLCIAGFMAVLSVVTDNIYLMSAAILLQLLFGGFTVPVLTGYMIAQVPPNLRTLANSLANLFYNLLGFFPAPSIYGVVYQSTGSGTSRWGLISIQFFATLSVFILLPIVAVKRCRDNKSITSYLNQHQQEVEQEINQQEPINETNCPLKHKTTNEN